jgi:hypothetical protein
LRFFLGYWTIRGFEFVLTQILKGPRFWKTLLLILTCLFALSFGLNAQTIEGASLSGPPDNPLLVNNSGKTIIAALAVAKKQGWAPLVMRVGFWNKGALAAGSSASLVGSSAKNSGGVITSVDLYAVVFEDGEIRGRDAYQFQEYIEGRIASRVAIGALVSAGRWDEVESAANATDGPYGHASQAKELLAARQTGGERAAQDLAKKYQATPTKLWRKE